jgi:hypothetical protein
MFGLARHVRDRLSRGDLDDDTSAAFVSAAQALLFSGFVLAAGGRVLSDTLAAHLQAVIDAMKPLADRGLAELKAAKRAEIAAHGPKEERDVKYAHWQSVVNEIAAKRSAIPFRRRNGAGDDVLTLAARQLGIPKGTLKDHVRNPRRRP